MVRLAKAMVADGLASSASSGMIREISKLQERGSETRVHEVLNKFNEALPIPIRHIHDKPHLEGFPRLKPMDFLHYMAASGHLNKLMGGRSINSCGDMLEEFWSNYRKQHEDFELFHMDMPELSFKDCIPIFAHIDGGRGYKKSECMIFSFCSVIGYGCGKKNGKDPLVRSFKQGQKTQDSAQLPLLGHSFLSHYLFAAMPQSFHKNAEDAFQELLCTFAEDLRECFDEGVSFQGRVLRLVLLGLKGDLKMQSRAGRLTRWYATARKKPIGQIRGNQTSGRCCWLCPAGDAAIPYEEISTETPAWWTAMQSFSEPPWEPGKEGGMIQASFTYLERPEKFYLPDLFHVYLAGIGQDYAASCLVYMLPHTFHSPAGNSVDAQLEMLNKTFTLWRRMFKVSVNLTCFNRDRLSFQDATKTYPSGTWSKAADTARIIQFIAYTCSMFPELCKHDKNKIMYYIQLAAISVGDMMKGLYDAGLWIAPHLNLKHAVMGSPLSHHN